MNRSSISVVVPTCRAHLARRTVDALLGQQDVEAQIVVVENGCPRPARLPWLARLAAAGAVRHIHRRPANLNGARNAGLAAAGAEFVAFTDDDCTPGPGWCRALLDALLRDEITAVAGGPVVLDFPGDPPGWLRGPFCGYLSALDLGAARRELARGEWLVGANIAFRRSVIDALGGFDETIGMQGDEPASAGNDEMELVARVTAGSRRRAVYEPSAVVHHRIPARRLNPGYFRDRRYGQGRSDFIVGWSAGTLRDYADVHDMLWWRLRDLFGYLGERQAGELGTAARHERYYAGCVVAYALGFYRSAVARLARAGPGADAVRAMGGRIGRMLADESGEAAVLDESCLALEGFLRARQNGPARESHLHRWIAYVDGLNDEIARRAGSSSVPAGGNAPAAMAIARALPGALRPRSATICPATPDGSYDGDDPEIACDLFLADEPGDRPHRVSVTLLRVRAVEDGRWDCPQDVLRQAGLLLTCSVVELNGSRFQVIDDAVRRPSPDDPDDVRRLCEFLGACLRLPVDDGSLTAFRDRRSATRRYWSDGVCALAGSWALRDERRVGAGPRPDLTAVVEEACEALDRLPIRWQPSPAGLWRDCRLSPGDEMFRVTSATGITLRPGVPSVVGLIDRVGASRTGDAPGSLVSSILGGEAARWRCALAWSRVAVTLDRIAWRFASGNSAGAATAHPAGDADPGEWVKVLQEALETARRSHVADGEAN